MFRLSLQPTIMIIIASAYSLFPVAISWSRLMRYRRFQTGANVNAVLSGSRLLLMKGLLPESPQGLFELIPVSHWSYGEME